MSNTFWDVMRICAAVAGIIFGIACVVKGVTLGAANELSLLYCGVGMILFRLAAQSGRERKE